MDFVVFLELWFWTNRIKIVRLCPYKQTVLPVLEKKNHSLWFGLVCLMFFFIWTINIVWFCFGFSCYI